MTSRLPTVGGDGNAWAGVLNDFLSVAHNSDGTLKNLFVNVKDPAYGATGNGSTDDTAAIQAAINAAVSAGGGFVYFPAGAYSISASLVVDADNIGLIGLGQREAAPVIATTAADPAYALVVGNTKVVNNCHVYGLNFRGRNSGASTGGGINFRSGSGKIGQCKVGTFGGTGINLNSFSGTSFEVLFEDVDLVMNGMNTITPGDNLVIGSGMSDCEYHRVISEGANAKNTTKNGITISGAGQQKFVDCHIYNCSNYGLNIASGTGCEFIGGEIENNAVYGILAGGNLLSVIGTALFGNGQIDVVIFGSAIVSGCMCSSVGNQNIYSTSAAGAIISGCILSSSANAIYLDTGCSQHVIHNNICGATSTVIHLLTTNSDIHDNVLTTSGGIVEVTGANTNSIHDNVLVSGTITKVGAATWTKNNRGYNPVGSVSPPAFPASTVAATNTTGVDVTAYIVNSSAAITVIQIAGAGGSYVTTGQTIAISGTANIRIPAGGGVKFTYASGSPTWTWFGD